MGLRPALERVSIVSGFTRGVEHGDEVLGVVERRQGSEHLFRTAYHTERKSWVLVDPGPYKTVAFGER